MGPAIYNSVIQYNIHAFETLVGQENLKEQGTAGNSRCHFGHSCLRLFSPSQDGSKWLVAVSGGFASTGLESLEFCVNATVGLRRRWEDNIKMDLQEVGGGRGDWMDLAQVRDGWRALVGTVRNFRGP